MSKGNDIYKARLTRDLVAEVEVTIESRNRHSRNTPWDMSAFIRAAIREKLAHMARSRGRRLPIADRLF